MSTIFVTGAARGIGREIALRFAREGHRLAINCLTSTDHMNELLSLLGDSAIGIQADLSVYSEAEAAFNTIARAFGEVDVLVNNAGVSYIGLFNQMAPDSWRRIWDCNLNTAVNCSHLAVPSMIRKKQGAIINISSIWGQTGASCEVIYSASKAALNGFTMALAKELGPCGVRINAVACGVIDTSMNAKFSEDEKNALREEIPLGRFGTAAEAASLVYYLASNEASYLTGQIITLDGGMI